MKKAERSRTRRGAFAFSLLELLVVIALIAILAALVSSGISGILKSVKVKEARLWLASLEAGLSDYQQDHGIFPLNPPGDVPPERTDSLAREGAPILYRALSGDTDMDAQGIIDDSEQVYVEGLSFHEQKNAEVPRSAPLAGGFGVIDPWSSPIRYLASPPNLPVDRKVSHNPDFDLWFLGGGAPDETENWVSNWGAR